MAIDGKTLRGTAERLRALGDHYVLEVKENQPTLYETLSSEYTWSGRPHRTIDGTHGRIDTRTIRVSGAVDRAVPVPWFDFPEARRASQVVRETVYKKTGRPRETETACWSSTGALGAFRTASTTSATRCTARTSAGCAGVCCRACWRRCRTLRSRSSGCWGSQPRAVQRPDALLPATGGRLGGSLNPAPARCWVRLAAQGPVRLAVQDRRARLALPPLSACTRSVNPPHVRPNASAQHFRQPSYAAITRAKTEH